jgi:hypothetical protein
MSAGSERVIGIGSATWTREHLDPPFHYRQRIGSSCLAHSNKTKDHGGTVNITRATPSGVTKGENQ